MTTTDPAERLRALIRDRFDPISDETNPLLAAALAAAYQRGQSDERERIRAAFADLHQLDWSDGEILRWFADLCDAALAEGER